MSAVYYDVIQLVERLHRYFLDVVKTELDRQNMQDINNVQAMILYNIGHDDLTVGELTLRGYYLGSNVSYNVKKMVENGYIVQERSVHDKRSIRVKLSDKGKKLHKIVSEMLSKHLSKLDVSDLGEVRLNQTLQTLKLLERFWSSQTSFSGLASLEDFD
ncbi:MAG: MarR family winged helix-turn-helix transcriptional regulator [Pseudomonadota bacterium]